MLRYNEQRNLIGFKYNNRSIRIFPIFDESDLPARVKNSPKDKVSNNSERVEDVEE